MTSIDVRSNEIDFTEIRFADTDYNRYRADTLKKVESDRIGGIAIHDSNASRYLEINTIEHADNLIKAIEKAKQLGWLK